MTAKGYKIQVSLGYHYWWREELKFKIKYTKIVPLFYQQNKFLWQIADTEGVLLVQKLISCSI